MTTRIRKAALIFALLALALAARGADDAFRVDYTVEVASVPDAQFHVTAEVKNIHQDSLDLSLPVWTPGWYVIENYARNISYFSISGPDGKRLNHERTRKQTWRVETKGFTALTIQFDYSATKLALNQAKIARNFSYFTGTELFLMAEGHRDCSSSVTLKAPKDWKAISSLKESAPFKFSAANYDELVDCPVLMGEFDVLKFQAFGKPHFIVMAPKGKFPEERAKELPDGLAKIVQAAGDVFFGAPYDKYMFLYFFQRAET
ncbi:MAG TPA: hypothetical protein VKX17_11260, partial [Planctomycetota bacterium]|nr:hypothetical protein [Planctomycetota bacterium]